MPFNYQTLKKNLSFVILTLLPIIIFGCSSGRYAEKNSSSVSESAGATIRVLMDDGNDTYNYTVTNPVILLKDDIPVALVKDGNELNFKISGSSLLLTIADKSYSGSYFQLKPADGYSYVGFNGKKYGGVIKFVSENSRVRVINSIPLEEYVKGVIPAEMPTGKGNEYFEALKAFAICVRTYAVNKLKRSGSSFDVYLDTRDQVYGGISAEKQISDKAADETKNMILSYEGNPAIVFYHASCGGYTEKASHVFPVPDLPYLKGVRDGDPPNCSIAPNFEWTVKFSHSLIIKRLRESNLITGENYRLSSIEVTDRFESGRVNELSILLNGPGGDKRIVIKSNRIRYILKPPDSQGILRSNLFNIFTDGENNVILKGRGYGHGVGLCQWGALHLSEEGNDYKSILSFYFPGTAIMELR